MADPIATDWLLPLLAAPFAGGLLAGFARRMAAEAGSGVACPHCAKRLPTPTLVPVIGWPLARGRCGHCAAALGATTPVIELGSLVIAVWAAAMLDGWLVWASCVLGWTLLALAAIDRRDLVLPDEFTLPLIPAGIAVAYFIAPGLPAQHLIGAVAGFAVFVLVRWAYRRLRGREGLGLGDAKLLAAAGAWVGWVGLALRGADRGDGGARRRAGAGSRRATRRCGPDSAVRQLSGARDLDRLAVRPPGFRLTWYNAKDQRQRGDHGGVSARQRGSDARSDR